MGYTGHDETADKEGGDGNDGDATPRITTRQQQQQQPQQQQRADGSPMSFSSPAAHRSLACPAYSRRCTTANAHVTIATGTTLAGGGWAPAAAAAAVCPGLPVAAEGAALLSAAGALTA